MAGATNAVHKCSWRKQKKSVWNKCTLSSLSYQISIRLLDLTVVGVTIIIINLNCSIISSTKWDRRLHRPTVLQLTYKAVSTLLIQFLSTYVLSLLHSVQWEYNIFPKELKGLVAWITERNV